MPIKNQRHMDSSCKDMTKAIQRTIKSKIPVTTITLKSKHWWTKELTQLCYSANKLAIRKTLCLFLRLFIHFLGSLITLTCLAHLDSTYFTFSSFLKTCYFIKYTKLKKNYQVLLKQKNDNQLLQVRQKETKVHMPLCLSWSSTLSPLLSTP